MNHSLFDILQTFDFSLKYNNDYYLVFYKNKHIIYVYLENNSLRFLDNNLETGSAEKLYQLLSSSIEFTGIIKSTYDTVILKSTNFSNIITKVLALKPLDEDSEIPSYLKSLLYSSDNGSFKLLLKNGKLISNIISLSGESLNTNGGYLYYKSKDSDSSFLKIYTDTSFLNQDAEEDFIFIHNIQDWRILPNLYTLISQYIHPTLIPEETFFTTFKAYVTLLSFFHTGFSFSISQMDNQLSIHNTQKEQLRKLCNTIQRDLKKMAIQYQEEGKPCFDSTLYDFFYYSTYAVMQLPKSNELLKRISALLILKVSTPIQIANINYPTND
jgi:hypothetical protein